MALISTEELFKEYFKSRGGEISDKIRKQIERPELYEYEKEIGKQFVDMNEEDIFNLFASFTDLKYRTILQIASFYRGIIDFYSYNYEPIINQFHKKEFRGMELVTRITKDKKKFTMDDVDYAINRIHSVYSDSVAKTYYLECIIRLFLDGFANAIEIVNLKEKDICFEKREVTISKRVITLSERTMMLLKYVHDMNEIESYRVTFKMMSWDNGYFKYPIRESNTSKFLAQDKAQTAAIINRKLSYDINKMCEINISYINLYYLGVYLKFVDKFGEEKAKQIIYTDNLENAYYMMDFIDELQLSVKKGSYLKAYFREFV